MSKLRLSFIAKFVLVLLLGTPGGVGAAPQDQEVPCDGTPRERGEAFRQAVEQAADGTAVLLGACEYFVDAVLFEDYDYSTSPAPYHAGVRIHGKSDLTIQGAGRGRTVVRFPRSTYIGIEIRSNTSGLSISDLTITGSISGTLCEESPDQPRCYGPPASSRPGSHGIASSGRTSGVRDVLLTRLEVRELAVGISVGSSGTPNCDYRGATVSHNHVHHIYGTYGGSGYGIHAACATGVVIRDNVVERVGRHAIYIAKSPPLNPDGTAVVRNLIVDSGHAESISEHAAAIALVRSDNVTVIDNTLVGVHTYGISVEFDHETGLDCTRCSVIGNEFVNARSPADIWVNAHSPAWLWSNQRGPGQPATVLDDSGSARDAAGPGMFWAGTQAIASSHDAEAGVDRLYVMQNDVLHVVRPDYGVGPDVGWRDYHFSSERWPGFVSMAAAGHEVLVLWQGDSLHTITPHSTNSRWPSTRYTGWPGGTAIAEGSDGWLYVLSDSLLKRVAGSRAETLWAAPGVPQSFGVAAGTVYLSVEDTVYALEIGALEAQGGVRAID